ncbi:hypothetical protein [Aquimarina intermedia]|uniref:Phage portal protein n=1 Tax=Aquimarina intermedia TaxID=350814 RepID=A0A5S5BWB8_9FLAO|nr:hypothetical protein [Aquimarina intermedia]TYP71481.1 hypothetical protein BD809_10963 [Aquimarina intermedia]
MKNLAFEFIELFNKLPFFNKKAGIYNNGVDNNYPVAVESGINNSVTALTCRDLMKDYLSGKGFGDDINKILVHEEKEITLLQFVQDISESYATHKGFYIQVNYNAACEIIDADVLPFTDCRVGKKDDNKYNGKILVCKDWNDSKAEKTATKIDVFNPDKKVIQYQIDKAEGVDNYNGQILYYHASKYVYPLAPIHPCLFDAESEYNASVYKKNSLKKGFFGKTLVVTKPLVDNLIKESEPKEYQQQISERDKFRETIQSFIGAENADGVLHLEMEFDSDKIEEEILFKNIDSNIDDKLFAHTESSVSDNIRMCFKNVPAALIRSKDGAIFGQSGEAIKQMKLFYQDQTANERLIIEQNINKIMKHFVNPITELKIVPLITVSKEVENVDQ